MSNHAKALAFIKMLVEKFDKGGYIFRGTVRRYSLERGYRGIRDGINSNLYRWVVKEKKEGDIGEEQETLRKIFSDNKYFSPQDIEGDIVDNVGKHFPSNTKNQEILTELQHFGGKTNMIDFSRNMYVALFFACQKCPNKNGELVAVREEELERNSKIDYAKHPKEGVLSIIEPTLAHSSRHRVRSQSSVFVHPADGYINPDFCVITPIPAEIKKPLSEYLQAFHNMTVDTIYNDMHGFIKNEKNNETALLYFFIALAAQKSYNNDNAIKYYHESIRRNRYLTAAYYNLGNAYLDSEEYTLAIENYDKAISLNPDYGAAYLNRGLAKRKKGNKKGANADFAKAKEYGFTPPEEE